MAKVIRVVSELMNWRFLRVLIAAGLAILLPGPLPARDSGDQVLKIHQVDTRDFPEISIITSIHPPYPGFAIPDGLKKEPMSIRLEEHYNGRQTGINPAFIVPEAGRADNVNLVLVMDYTKSISISDFDQMKNDALYVIGSLEERDMAAIYSFNSTPRLESEFITDRVRLREVIKSLERVGNETRVFDALYSGIFSARRASGMQVTDDSLDQSVVVIFTDGKDEGSYLKEGDLHEILSVGVNNRIPVFTVLYGKAKNLNLFRRLAMKTGGEVIQRDDSPQDIDTLVDRIRRIPGRTYRLKYKSSAGISQVPLLWKKITLKLNIYGIYGPGEDTVSFSVPFRSMIYEHISANFELYRIIFAGLLLIGGLLLFIFVVSRMRKNNHRRNENAGHDSRNFEVKSSNSKIPVNEDASLSDTIDSGDEKHILERESDRWADDTLNDEPEKFVDHSAEDYNLFESSEKDVVRTTAEKAAPVKKIRSAYKAAEENEFLEDAPGSAVSEKPPADPFDPESWASPSEIELSSGIALTEEGERRVYMREYTYHILQNALRSGERYEDAWFILPSSSERDNERRYDLFLESTVVGSGKWANIRFRDHSVSPVHARIRRVDGKFVIYDMVSLTGTYVNDKKLLRPKCLNDGDEVRFGRIHLKFFGRP